MDDRFIRLRNMARILAKYGVIKPKARPFPFPVTCIEFHVAENALVPANGKQWHTVVDLQTPNGVVQYCEFQDPLFGDFGMTEIVVPNGIQPVQAEAALEVLFNLLKIQVAVKTGEYATVA